MEAGHLVDLDLLDPRSRLVQTAEYELFTSWRPVMAFRSIAILYLGMIAMTFALALTIWARG